MTQFEKSEVMMKYAELMQERTLIKTAWTWRDIVTDLGIGAIIDTSALAAGSAAAGAGWFGAGTAAGVAGAAAGGGTAGAAAGVAAGVAGGPLLWTILGGAAITMAMFHFTKQADDNLDDLIDRLEDLDTNDITAPKVNGWIETFNKFKPSIAMAPTTTDPAERAKLVSQQYMALKGLDLYLDQVKKEWPSVKSNLNDWVFDDDQAEYAINTTSSKIKESLAEIKKQVQSSAQEMMKKVQESTKIDYTGLAQSIVDLYDRLTKMSGDCPPKFDTPEEESAWKVANRILGKTEGSSPLTAQDIKVAGPLMQRFKTLLEEGVKKLSAKQTAKKESSIIARPLSKRALTLCDGTKITMPGDDSVAGKGRGKSRSLPITKKLQRLVNQLNEKYNPDATTIQEDGIYGPKTAAALYELLSVKKDLANRVSREGGVDMQIIQSPSIMRKNEDLQEAVYQTMSSETPTRTPSSTGISQRDVGTRVRCRPDKHDPTSDEIISCLKNYFKIQDPQTDEWMYAYYWLNTLGIYNEDTMVRLVQDQFPPGRYRPMDWSPAMFVSYVMNRLGGRPHG